MPRKKDCGAPEAKHSYFRHSTGQNRVIDMTRKKDGGAPGTKHSYFRHTAVRTNATQTYLFKAADGFCEE